MLRLNQFILGSQKIETPQQERKVLLGAYLILFYLVVDFFLFFVNLIDPKGIPWVLISGVLVSLFCLGLLQKGHTNLALFFYLLRANAIVFFFAQQEEIETGTFIYFISYGITPLAFYGYAERWKGMLYSSVTFALFIIAVFEIEKFHPAYAHFNLVVNYTIVLITLSFIILFFDAINRSAIQKINNQNKELVKANEELDRFVYSVSHDLRSPLASILGLVNVYRLSVSDQEKSNIVEMVKGRTLKLDDFIRKILDYSRNARREVQKETIALRQLTEDILSSLKFVPGFEDIQFFIKIAEDQIIQTDSERLKIIINNLLSNAIKYKDKTKQSFVTISAVASHSATTITVEDNGIGIKSEHISRIFQMFYRADQVSDGSGLGLYIASECISKLGGKLSVKSDYSMGSTFEVLVPNIP